VAKKNEEKKKAPVSDGTKLIARNKKATHEYEILEKIECGIALQGSEVKSLRDGRVSFADSYVRVLKNELILLGLNISEYRMANRFNHPSVRQRKLLAHRREINKLAMAMEAKGQTVVPLSMYFKRGKVKVEIALARGKATHDKRESLKKKDFDRHKQRVMRNFAK